MNQTKTSASGASGINAALGIWLIISPFILGFANNETAKWNAIAVGIAVVLLGLRGEMWLNLVLGIWLIASPFVLGFPTVPILLWNSVVLGALIAIVSFTMNSKRRTEPGPSAPLP